MKKESLARFTFNVAIFLALIISLLYQYHLRQERKLLLIELESLQRDLKILKTLDEDILQKDYLRLLKKEDDLYAKKHGIHILEEESDK